MSAKPGGVATNVARGLNRLGQQVSLVGAAGPDGAAAAVVEQLQAEGIDLALRERPGYPTGQYVALHNPDGTLAAACVDDRILSEAPPQLFDHQIEKLAPAAPEAIWFLDANLPAAMLERIAARLEGSRLIANAVSNAKAPRLRKIADRLSCLMLNRGEAVSLTQLPPDTDGAALLDAVIGFGPRQIVLTQGAGDVLVYDGGKRSAFQTPKADIVDVTGAGDALTAGIIAALGRGHQLMDAIPIGLRAAAITLASTGALSKALSWDAIS